MAYDFPPDLVQLQRAFLAADARCQEIGSALPTASAILDGAPVDYSELHQTRAERQDLAIALQQHPWWETLDKPDRVPAKAALRASARSGSQA